MFKIDDLCGRYVLMASVRGQPGPLHMTRNGLQRGPGPAARRLYDLADPAHAEHHRSNGDRMCWMARCTWRA